jgi:hypothetical protein
LKLQAAVYHIVKNGGRNRQKSAGFRRISMVPKETSISEAACHNNIGMNYIVCIDYGIGQDGNK